MLYTGLFKRIIPFVLTFAVGLFIASFFVTIAAPNFGKWRQGRREWRGHERRELLRENQELRQKYYQEVQKNNELRRQLADSDVLLESAVPPVELEAPHPPRRPKHPRIETLR